MRNDGLTDYWQERKDWGFEMIPLFNSAFSIQPQALPRPRWVDGVLARKKGLGF
jgi:hypothetical protein